MANVFFDGEGFKAEQLAVAQFGGKLLSDKASQYKDIDALLQSKSGAMVTVSVKDQLRGTKKGFSSVQLELTTINTRTGAKLKGCFLKNESQYYFWRIWTAEYGDTWAIVESAKLRAWVKENYSTLRKWSTKPETEAKNRSYGRTYDRSEGVELEISVMKQLGQLKPVEGTEQ